MYAELDSNDQLVAGEPVNVHRYSRSFTYVVGGVTFTAPRNWMADWTPAQKEAAHMWPLV